MSEPDHLESDVLRGAALALRRRANLHSAVLSDLAEEFEGVA